MIQSKLQPHPKYGTQLIWKSRVTRVMAHLKAILQRKNIFVRRSRVLTFLGTLTVAVGRSSDEKHYSKIWARAEKQKPQTPKKVKKKTKNGRTHGRTKRGIKTKNCFTWTKEQKAKLPGKKKLQCNKPIFLFPSRPESAPSLPITLTQTIIHHLKDTTILKKW